VRQPPWRFFDARIASVLTPVEEICRYLSSIFWLGRLGFGTLIRHSDLVLGHSRPREKLISRSTAAMPRCASVVKLISPNETGWQRKIRLCILSPDDE
jgi:hypothetical protein